MLPASVNEQQFLAVHRAKAGSWEEEQTHCLQTTSTIISCSQSNPKFSFRLLSASPFLTLCFF